MLNREGSRALMHKYIENPALRHHCEMVAKAMAAYAQQLGLTSDEVEVWFSAGLLHDLDWEKFSDEHPLKATKEILPALGYPIELLNAINAHAPERTGYKPTADIEKYLFACDELSGFIHAASLIRPTGYIDMESKSIIKKLKDKRFAEGVSREDIRNGAELIGKDLPDHINFLIDTFRNA